MCLRIARGLPSMIVIAEGLLACSQANPTQLSSQADRGGNNASLGVDAGVDQRGVDGGKGLNDTPTDVNIPSDVDERLAEVDSLIDYGYADDPLLNALSRAAGHAGVAQCVCFDLASEVEFLAGCALDEARTEFDALPIDYDSGMQCAIEVVGRETLVGYVECALELLAQQQLCYLTLQGSDNCGTCVQAFDSCPGSEAVIASDNVCAPNVDEPPPRTRRLSAE